MSQQPAATDLPLLRALAPRVPAAGLSFRTRMLEIAADLPDVISLSRGDPDFDTPQHVVEAAKAAIDAGQHHYTHPAGLLELRQAIAQKLRSDHDLTYTPDELIVTGGVQEAIVLCMLALVEDGDEVLLPVPGYSSYDNAIRFFGGKPVPILTHEDYNFTIRPTDIEARVTERTKVLIFVNPGNPTGAVTSPAVIREVAALAARRDLIVISDEIYADLIFDGFGRLSIGSLPGMKERTITLNGLSKSHAMTGWRIGYLAAPEPFTHRLIEPRHTFSINASTPAQFAALAALTGPQDVVRDMRNAYRQRLDHVMTTWDRVGLSYAVPGGGFALYASVSGTGLSAEMFCERLLREERVLTYPGSMFGDDSGSYVRLSVVQPLDRIKEATARTERFVGRCLAGTSG